MKEEYKKKLQAISRLEPENQPIVLAALLSRLFLEHDVLLTVVGGAAVQFYTQAAYQTKDLDCILHGDWKELNDKTMGDFGFRRTSMYRHFENPHFNFVVEFPPSPVEVGSRHIEKLAKIQTSEGEVRIIRLEDIIMDRIVAGVEWRDPPSLEQAKLLWIKNKDRIDRKYLKQFAKEEGYSEVLKKIMNP